MKRFNITKKELRKTILKYENLKEMVQERVSKDDPLCCEVTKFKPFRHGLKVEYWAWLPSGRYDVEMFLRYSDLNWMVE